MTCIYVKYTILKMTDTVINNCIGFEWDVGNSDKNWSKQQVSSLECEQIFFNTPLLLYSDDKHSCQELRYYVLGRTDNDRLLFVVFTTRNNLIRVISARDMSKKERKIYEEKITEI